MTVSNSDFAKAMASKVYDKLIEEDVPLDEIFFLTFIINGTICPKYISNNIVDMTISEIKELFVDCTNGSNYISSLTACHAFGSERGFEGDTNASILWVTVYWGNARGCMRTQSLSITYDFKDIEGFDEEGGLKYEDIR